jgi:hypothetical protein
MEFNKNHNITFTKILSGSETASYRVGPPYENKTVSMNEYLNIFSMCMDDTNRFINTDGSFNKRAIRDEKSSITGEIKIKNKSGEHTICKLKKVYFCKNNWAGYFLFIYENNIAQLIMGGSGMQFTSPSCIGIYKEN